MRSEGEGEHRCERVSEVGAGRLGEGKSEGAVPHAAHSPA